MAAKVIATGQVMAIAATATRPAGSLQAGGYDPATNTLHLGNGRAGHPWGMSAAGGDPSALDVAGISVFQHEDGRIFWANDSPSLRCRLTHGQAVEIQAGLEAAYPGAVVTQLTRIGQVPK